MSRNSVEKAVRLRLCETLQSLKLAIISFGDCYGRCRTRLSLESIMNNLSFIPQKREGLCSNTSAHLQKKRRARSAIYLNRREALPQTTVLSRFISRLGRPSEA